MKVLKVMFTVVVCVIAAIFALYCKAGYFDFVWYGTANVAVPLALVGCGLYLFWRTRAVKRS